MFLHLRDRHSLGGVAGIRAHNCGVEPRGFTLDDDQLNAAVSRVGFGPTVALDARPLGAASTIEIFSEPFSCRKDLSNKGSENVAPVPQGRRVFRYLDFQPRFEAD